MPTGPQGPGASARPSASISPSPPANAAAAAGSSVAVAAHTRTIELPKHPLSSVGGDWQIKVGRVGAAKGIGLQGCRSVGEGGELQQGHTAGGSSGGGAGDKVRGTVLCSISSRMMLGGRGWSGMEMRRSKSRVHAAADWHAHPIWAGHTRYFAKLDRYRLGHTSAWNL
eukprot:1014657-Pelagomonas_calceolata.AAC.1